MVYSFSESCVRSRISRFPTRTDVVVLHSHQRCNCQVREAKTISRASRRVYQRRKEPRSAALYRDLRRLKAFRGARPLHRVHHSSREEASERAGNRKVVVWGARARHLVLSHVASVPDRSNARKVTGVMPYEWGHGSASKAGGIELVDKAAQSFGGNKSADQRDCANGLESNPCGVLSLVWNCSEFPLRPEEVKRDYRHSSDKPHNVDEWQVSLRRGQPCSP